MQAISDPTWPGHQVLDVVYGAGSSAHSCTNCPNPGGGQFYQDVTKIGHADFAASPVLYMRYYLKFPTNWDWGRAGKLPGLFGGVPGCESGGNHCAGWSTRYMWRGAGPGEIYLYVPSGSGFGTDIGLGSWSFVRDGNWHYIEQAVNRQTGNVTVWYDGTQVLSSNVVTGVSGINFSGVFFSTFFGGHDTTWGPQTTVHAYFADFAVSTQRIGK